tara:strand:- start:256 stop:384 length:129 start_codon:yes stop_codon:yes gene_type:complete
MLNGRGTQTSLVWRQLPVGGEAAAAVAAVAVVVAAVHDCAEV